MGKVVKDHTIVKTYRKGVLDDPFFAEALKIVASWANKQGLINVKCTNFKIHLPGEDPLDMLSGITCDMEENKGEVL